MKKIFFLIVVATIIPTSILCFCLGRNYEEKYYGSKYYEDACHMSDLIRHFNDHTDNIVKLDHVKEVFEGNIVHYLKEYDVNLSDYVWEY